VITGIDSELVSLSVIYRHMPPTMTAFVHNIFGAVGDERNNPRNDAAADTQNAGDSTSKELAVDSS
jgi:hypothetical protein